MCAHGGSGAAQRQAAHGRSPTGRIPLTVTKGSRRRTVYPPLRLIDRTNWYIGEDRAGLITRLWRRDLIYAPPNTLFLNRRGAPITKARLSAAFARGFAAAGLDGSAHWLRHTFATVMLVRLQAQAQRNPDINPLKVLQVRLATPGSRRQRSICAVSNCMETRSPKRRISLRTRDRRCVLTAVHRPSAIG